MDKLEEGWQSSKNYFDSSDFIPLDIIEKSDIQNFQIKNFEPKTQIEKFALLEDGRFLLVSSNGNTINASDCDWEIVVHFGKPKDLKLYENPHIGISSIFYSVDFLIDSLRASAYFTKEWITTDSFRCIEMVLLTSFWLIKNYLLNDVILAKRYW